MEIAIAIANDEPWSTFRVKVGVWAAGYRLRQNGISCDTLRLSLRQLSKLLTYNQTEDTHMAQGQQTRNISFNVLTLIPLFIRFTQLLHGHAPGAEKKALVKDAVSAVLTIGGNAVAANNPQMANEIGAIIDGTVALLKGSGAMPEPLPEPTPDTSK